MPPRRGPSPLQWALIVLVVLVTAAGAGVGVFLSTRADPEPTPTPLPEPTPTPTPTPAAEVDEGKPQTLPPAPVIEPDASTLDLALAGVDLSWVELPSAASYGEWAWVSDDTGAVTVELPAAWADVNGSRNVIDGVEVASLWAAPLLSDFTESWSGPGMTLEAYGGTLADREPAAILQQLDDLNGAGGSCEQVRSYDYDDGWYVGAANLWAGCGGTGSALLHIVAWASSDMALVVQVQMTTLADVEAAAAIINSFQLVTTAPAPQPQPQPQPQQPAQPQPQPVPQPAPQSVDDLPSGLLCRDLQANGWSYAEAVEYWSWWGYPDRMDADLDGIPCETVYSSGDVEAYWGPVDGGTDFDGADAVAVVEGLIWGCGYTPVEIFWEGPFPDASFTVTATVDVGGEVVAGMFDVLPDSEVFPIDVTADALLHCGF